MFASVGRARKVNRKRQAGAASFAILILLQTTGFSALTSGQRVTEIEIDAVDVEFVEFMDAAPPPPPPPPPPASSAQDEEEEEEEEEEEDEEEEEEEEELEVEELEEEIPEPVVAQAVAGGMEGGVEGGVEGGEVGGVEGGVIGGVLGGQLGGTGINTVHWSQVQVKRKVQPKYPQGARELNMEGDCQVRFFIDEKGKVYDVKLEACPTAFHKAATEAAWKWSFYPMKVDGQKVKTTFVLNLQFKLS